jgi:hypothetical protein
VRLFQLFSVSVFSILVCAGCRAPEAQVARVANSKLKIQNSKLSAASTIAPARTVTIAWSYPVASNIVFNLYSSPDLRLPIHAWPITAVIPGELRTWTVPAIAPAQFFALTASNFVTRQESAFAGR